MSARLWDRLLSLFRRRRLDAELDRDIQEHIELAIEENLRRGMTAEDATAAARRSFGNVAQMKENYRQERGLPWLDTIVRDIRLTFRSLRRDPGFAAVAILTLALGIGANAAIFSVTHGVVLRPLPYPDADRLTIVLITHAQQNLDRMPLSVADFLDWRAANRAFDKAAAYSGTSFNLTGDAGPEQVRGAVVTADFFAALGAQPELGRTFQADAERPGAAAQAVISHSLWQRQFKGDPQIAGRLVTMDDAAVSIIGVMPAGFAFDVKGTDIWKALILKPPPRRGPYYLTVLARRRPEVTLAQAQAELQTVARRIESANPESNRDTGFEAIPLHEYVVGDVRTPLYMLSGAVFFVLLIASANVGNLMLARTTAREREIAVRTALGASRWRLTMQLLTESLVLAGIAGVCGVALAFWGTRLLQLFGPDDLPRLEQITVDFPVLLYACTATLGSGIFFGLAPAMRSGARSVQDALKQNGRGIARGGRFRNAMIVTEFALCLMLLVGAGLILKSLVRLQRVDAGFNPANVLTADITVTTAKYPDDRLASFYDELLSRIRQIPGVQHTALSSSLPPNLLSITDSFSIEGRPWPREQQAPIGPVLFVSPDYFQAMGISLQRGRNFVATDRGDSPQVTLISEAMAKRYSRDEDPIGKRIKVGGPERPNAPWMEIVGIVGDARYSGLDAPVEPARYQTLTQVPWIGLYLIVKTSTDPLQTLPAIKSELARLDPGRAARAHSHDEPDHRSSRGPAALPHCAARAVRGSRPGSCGGWNLWGDVLSVSRRAREIGIRVSLGAGRGEVLTMLLREGFTLSLIGVALGIIGSIAITRYIAALLFEVSPDGPIDLLCGFRISARGRAPRVLSACKSGHPRGSPDRAQTGIGGTKRLVNCGDSTRRPIRNTRA